MRKYAALVLLLIFPIMLSGCTVSKTNINIGGSTSVQPLFEDLIEDYMSENKDVNITYDGQGSSASVQGVKDNAYAIGTASRDIKDEEKDDKLQIVTIAHDVITVIINKDNKLSSYNLTMQELHDIYTGKITNWKELGGEDTPILLISRDSASGTREAFETTVDFNTTPENMMPKGALEFGSNAEVLNNIENNKGAIGYVSLDSINDDVKTLDIDGIAPTLENLENGTYEISRPYNIVFYNDNLTKADQQFLDWVYANNKYYLKHHALGQK